MQALLFRQAQRATEVAGAVALHYAYDILQNKEPPVSGGSFLYTAVIFPAPVYKGR